jgi:glycosyltransferase involved in cell wall biosynthesis
MVRSAAALRMIDTWCRLIYHKANRLVVLSPGFKSALVKRGVSADKVDVIYNWCDEEALGKKADPEEIGSPGEFKVLFAGTMGLAQALDPVLEGARLCQRSAPKVRFVFVGGGVERSRLEQKAIDAGLSNVTFLPRRPPNEMGALFAAADALLVHLKDDPLFRITIPSKTQAYLLAGKPIVMGVGGDAADLVLRAKAGVVCRPEDPESIAAAVCSLARADVSRLEEMGRAGRSFYEKELSIRVGVSRFEEVFRSAVN